MMINSQHPLASALQDQQPAGQSYVDHLWALSKVKFPFWSVSIMWNICLIPATCSCGKLSATTYTNKYLVQLLAFFFFLKCEIKCFINENCLILESIFENLTLRTFFLNLFINENCLILAPTFSPKGMLGTWSSLCIQRCSTFFMQEKISSNIWSIVHTDHFRCYLPLILPLENILAAFFGTLIGHNYLAKLRVDECEWEAWQM